MSVKINDDLKLQVSGTYLYIKDNQSAENIKWVIDNEQEIRIYTEVKGTYILKINNTQDLPVEQFLLDSVNDDPLALEDGLFCYKGVSKIAKFLKSGSKIKLGVIYSNGEETKSTTTLLIELINSIGDAYVTPEDLDANFSIITDLINKFSDAKAVEKFETKKKNNDVHLYVKYYREDTLQDLGKISSSLYELGIQNARSESGTSGGGQTGVDSKATGGFAGGYKAQTNNGAAIGENAFSIDGVALGKSANSIERDSIVVGAGAYIKNRHDTSGKNLTNGNIAIGTEANIRNSSPDDHYNNIAIGRRAYIEQSQGSIAIGSRLPSEEGQGYSTEIWKNCTMPYAVISNVTRRCVQIGSRNYIKDGVYSIAIGSDVAAVGSNSSEPIYYGISVGAKSLVRERACIAIGSYAKAGVELDGARSKLNSIMDSAMAKGAIAIGAHVWARRYGCIAIGRKATSCFANNIAIGNGAMAGKEDDVINSKTNKYNYTDGSDNNANSSKASSFAIAIGYKAQALAYKAAQIGPGTNKTKKSLQFMNTQIVNSSGKVTADLNYSRGTVPIEKGGTGATNREKALNNLGIYYGSAPIKITSSNYTAATSKDSTGAIFTIKFPGFKLASSSSSKPYIIASLRTANSDPKDINPLVHSVIVTKINTDSFEVKYKYNGSLKKNDIIKSSNKIFYLRLHYIIIRQDL